MHTRSRRHAKPISANGSKSLCHQEQCSSEARRRGGAVEMGDGLRWISPAETLWKWDIRRRKQLDTKNRGRPGKWATDWVPGLLMFCGWCRLKRSVRSSYSDQNPFPFGSGMRMLLAHLWNRKPLFLSSIWKPPFYWQILHWLLLKRARSHWHPFLHSSGSFLLVPPSTAQFSLAKKQRKHFRHNSWCVSRSQSNWVEAVGNDNPRFLQTRESRVTTTTESYQNRT